MPVFKNEANGTWYVMARYVNWKGERKQKCKRGFSTKKEAQEWERMFQLQNSSDMDMSFEAFTELVYPGYEKPSEGEYMADKGAYHPHKDFTLFRQVENQRDFYKRGYRMAE